VSLLPKVHIGILLRLLMVLVCAWVPLAAQQASPYVPLRHWAMPYVEHLIAMGVVRDPTPLTRPLRQADLVAALEAVDTMSIGDAAFATVRRLLAEFKPRSPGDRLRLEGDAGLAAASEPMRDPLEIGRGVPPRPVGPSHGFVSGGVALQALLGPVVLVTHPTEDTRLRFDPDWYDTRRNGFRPAEAYLSAQWRYGEVFFGVLDRNWGPSGIQGLLLSDNPYNFDHLAIRVGTTALQLQAIVAELDSRPDSTGVLANRFIFQHRLYIRPHGRWTLALWEGTVWAGANRQLEPWYLNLVNLGWIVQGYSGVGNANNFLGLDWERHGAVTAFGQFMLDDIQIQREGPFDLKPASYGLTVGAKGGLGGDAMSWTVFYTRVANLTYRNEDSLQVPLFHLLGTGRNFADYDQTTAKLRVLQHPGLLLEPELTLLRQGEGDPRLPHPLVTAYASTPTLFQGVVERTIRLAVGANWQSHRWSLIGNGGVHLIRNADHVTGAHLTRWVGSLGLNYHLHTEAALP
jgi:hypothetical protein